MPNRSCKIYVCTHIFSYASARYDLSDHKKPDQRYVYCANYHITFVLDEEEEESDVSLSRLIK